MKAEIKRKPKGSRGAPAKIYSKDDLLRSMRFTKSVRAAARYLGCSYWHIKVYFKMYRVDDNDVTSKTLFEIHKNQMGKGVPKFLPNKRKEPNVKNIIETGTGWESFTVLKIKSRLIAENFVKDECYKCGFDEKRVTDYKTPLLLNFKDSNKLNYLLPNLEMLCYNCYFLHVADPLTNEQIRSVENNEQVRKKAYDWETEPALIITDMDHIENMRALGLID
jgi:hypothetical protein